MKSVLPNYSTILKAIYDHMRRMILSQFLKNPLITTGELAGKSRPVDVILRKTMPFRLKKLSNHPIEPPKWLKLGSFE